MVGFLMWFNTVTTGLWLYSLGQPMWLCIYNLLYISRISLDSSAVISTTKLAETLVNKRDWLGLEDDFFFF